MTKRQGSLPPDRLLPIGFGLMALPWLATILAHLLQANGAIYAFVIGPFILMEIFVLPILALIEIGWFSYFIYAGGSLFDLELRKQRGREYGKLLPHFVGISILAISFLVSQNRNFKDWSFRQGRLTTDAELIENFKKNKPAFERLRTLTNGSEADHLIEKLQLEGIEGKNFAAYRTGWALSTESKGYAYRSVPPEPLIGSLDGPFPKDVHVAYRKIDDEWYLYSEWY